MKKNKKIKIAFVLRSLETGGAERQVIELASGLNKKNFESVIICFYNRGNLRKVAIEKKINIIFLEKNSRYDLYPFLKKFHKTIKEIKPDIVHSFLDSPNIITSLYKYFFPKYILLWGIRSSNMDLRYYPLNRRLSVYLEKFLHRIPEEIVFNSFLGMSVNTGKRFKKNKYSVIHNGIDTEYFRKSLFFRNETRKIWGLKNSDFVIGIVARDDPKKDFNTFIEAAKIAHKTNKQIYFAIITNRKETIPSLIKDYNLNKSFIIKTKQIETNKIYPAFDINTLTSSFGEGFPNVVAEGMSCGIPTVASNCGDSSLILGDNNYIFSPKNSDQLAKKWLRIVNLNAEKRIEIGEIHRKRIIDNFSKQIMIDNSENLYKKHLKIHD